MIRTRMKNKLKSGLLFGLIYGLFMFLIMGIAFPYSQGDEITLNRALIELFIWISGGMLVGFLVVEINARWPYKSKRKNK
jgi:hypothetical protein